jgi:hypothetical protein
MKSINCETSYYAFFYFSFTSSLLNTPLSYLQKVNSTNCNKCETWSLTLREECRLRVFENRVLRRIFGLKRDQVMGGWRKLHNEELHNVYSSPSIIRMMKSRRIIWAEHVAWMARRGMHIGWESQKVRDH